MNVDTLTKKSLNPGSWSASRKACVTFITAAKKRFPKNLGQVIVNLSP
jgi:hypothetical protein